MKTKEKKPLRCKLGFHKWIDLGYSGLMIAQNSQCAGCKIGRHSLSLIGDIYYSAEMMKEAWEAGKINNPTARALVYGAAHNATFDAQLSLFPPEMMTKVPAPPCCDKAHQ